MNGDVMGSHDEYGKQILRLANSGIEIDGPAITVDLGGGRVARIDGALRGHVAIEIDSRTSKQVRGAILDLLLHGARKKFLILVPMYMHNPEACRMDCATILGLFLPHSDYRVVVLKGTGDTQSRELDASIVRHALAELLATEARSSGCST
jgi:hypothetical protein